MLAVAALAAATAAVVTSKLWPGGTLISTAMTPVIVTLVKEWLRKPAERISAVSAKAPKVAARVVSAPLGDRRPGAPAGPPGGRRELAGRGFDEPAPPPVPPAPGEDLQDLVVPAPGSPDAGTPPRETFVEPARGLPSGYRLYRRHPFRWRLALVTGLLAFAVGAAVLTVPELVFGGAVATRRSTTVFGGGSPSSSQDKAQDQKAPGAKRSGEQGAKPEPGRQQPSAKPSSTKASSTSPRPSKKPSKPAPTTPNPSPPSPKPPSSRTPQSTTPTPPPSPSPTPPSPAPAPAP